MCTEEFGTYDGYETVDHHQGTEVALKKLKNDEQAEEFEKELNTLT